MDEIAKTRSAYNFINTYHACFNNIEFPILSDFDYGEIIFQTQDGKEFCVATLLDNKTFDFITDTLQHHKEFSNASVDAQKILALLADDVDGRQFTIEYPICPICKSRQRSFGDDVRSTKIELEFATWTKFEALSQEDKLSKIREAIDFINKY